MFEDYQICPYTGLRAFTEEESLYFKGRDEDIDAATAQLQQNKFLMLTGASGDGKSSLVYAGIIPNARSGFLKSKYSQWCVIDFRPERSPFQNLCRSIAHQLDIKNEHTVEAELRHGFSALVDLYKNSDRYIDEEAPDWIQKTDNEKAVTKRKAANLIILADQFEEFFTNPENYINGVPSLDANLVLNLLLETARIALEENLPIYIIFTMRSDYIGQCAAFRGLPEYIGFSQFFVPRLNRYQLQQVIEEPAVLSGNKITRRLTERLIHDLTEGVDQLPILQHALNQIWHAAEKGTEEMDLVHYAMVGGMSVSELPDEQVLKFNQWFDKLPGNIKDCYHSPSLQNVLDTHTNKLFEQAKSYFSNKTGKEIKDEDAKAIIQKAFTCLTKIDQSRAVRNRMTLGEITNIIGRNEFGPEEVGALLNIFREPGNTFIRPFITEDPESFQLKENDVLDITHESLIRNWEYLKRWAEEEYDDFTIYQDYEQQLNRWVENEKSSGFLMSIGPLTYFENWINRLKPNIYWIARYLPDDFDKEKKLAKAKTILRNSDEFLAKSARKHLITRKVMKYGAKRIGIAVALIAFLIFSSFGLRQYLRQQNSFVINSIQSEAKLLINSSKVGFEDKLYLIVEQLKLDLTSIDEVINSIPDPIEKINIATGIATLLVYQGQDEPKKEIFRSFSIADSLMAIYAVPNATNTSYSAILKELVDLRASLEMAYYYDADPTIDSWRKANAERAGNMVLHILESQPAGFSDMKNLTLALEHAVNYGVFNDADTQKLLNILSPFENGSPSDWIKNNFDPDKILVRGNGSYGFKHNGLYQQLAYIYASQGNSAKALDCIDVLLANAQVNFQGDYATGVDNAANIAFVFYKFRHEEALNEFVSGYSNRVRISEYDFYYRLIARMLKSLYTAQSLHLFSYMDEVQNLNLQFSSRADVGYFSKKFRESILSSNNNSDQVNWLLALSYKMEGILKAIHSEKPKDLEPTVNDLFDQAMGHFKSVSPNYLNEPITVLGISGSGELIIPRKFLFIYPDIRPEFHPNQPRTFVFFYYSDAFLEYILKNDLLETLYPNKSELDILPVWLQDYSSKLWAKERTMVRPIRFEILKELQEKLEKYPSIDGVDLNRLYLYLGKMANEKGDRQAAHLFYKKVKPEILLNLLQMPLFSNQINNHSLGLIAYAVSVLAASDDFETIEKFMSPFNTPTNRTSIYAFAAKDFLIREKNIDIADRLLDSAWVEQNRVGNYGGYQGNRVILSHVHILRDPKNNLEDAYILIKNLPTKDLVQTFMVRSIAFHGELYNSISNIPENTSSSNYAKFLSEILYGYSLGLNEVKDEWRQFQEGYPWFVNDWIYYLDGSF